MRSSSPARRRLEADHRPRRRSAAEVLRGLVGLLPASRSVAALSHWRRGRARPAAR